MDTIMLDILETIILIVIIVFGFSSIFTYLIFGSKKKYDKKYDEFYKNQKNIDNIT